MDNKILVLDQCDMDSSIDISERSNYYQRQAVRAVLSDTDGLIALMHAKKLDYYKLPGGGVDEGENLDQALARELLEETGYAADTLSKLGTVLEWRDFAKMKQISHAYTAKIVGEQGELSLTENEIENGFELVWVESLHVAISLVESKMNHNDLEVVFMATRDAAILKKAIVGAASVHQIAN